MAPRSVPAVPAADRTLATRSLFTTPRTPLIAYAMHSARRACWRSGTDPARMMTPCRTLTVSSDASSHSSSVNRSETSSLMRSSGRWYPFGPRPEKPRCGVSGASGVDGRLISGMPGKIARALPRARPDRGWRPSPQAGSPCSKGPGACHTWDVGGTRDEV